MVWDFLESVMVQNFNLLQIPQKTEIIYTTRHSRSGKSTFVRKYSRQCRKIQRKSDIFVFVSSRWWVFRWHSAKEIKPWPIYGDTMNLPDFANSVLIFDEVGVVSEKFEMLCVLYLIKCWRLADILRCQLYWLITHQATEMTHEGY